MDAIVDLQARLPCVPTIAFSICTLFIIYLVSAVYNIFLHPLSYIPGPKLNAVTKIPRELSLARGISTFYVKRLHDRYGEVVRIGPNEVCFITPAAWTDLHTSRPGHPMFPKDIERYGKTVNGSDNLFSGDDSTHSRQRRVLAHGFSEKALMDQEPVLHSHISSLIRKLREAVDGPENGRVDIMAWFNWTTFDVICDLLFGKPLGVIHNSQYRPWVTQSIAGLQISSLTASAGQFPLLAILLPFFLPKAGVEAITNYFNLAMKMAHNRMQREIKPSSRPDIIHHILQQKGDKGLTTGEIYANSCLMILAGSETSATCLSGAAYYLARTPEVRHKLTAEIRGHCASEAEITNSKVCSLPYLTAVIQETLRLYPPIPENLARVVPRGGSTVAGYKLPEGTKVSIYSWATYHSAMNFREPHCFIPERWLPENHEKFASDRRDSCQPFSIGQRNCIGKKLAYAEIRLILARLLFNFDMELCDESKDWLNQKTYLVWQKPALMVRLRNREGAKTV